ncbi:MAG: HAD-IA family hydrolase [Oscillospiraceae bacterium]|nr:HAD-IA family hydrolase [Oscillospiraceae bacterium]
MNLHNRTIRAAIFDMDGTMFDTERLRMQALQKASHEICGKSMDKEVLMRSLGLSAVASEALAKKTYGKDYPYKSIRSRADELELEQVRKDGVPVKDGLFEVLTRLKKAGVLLAVATSSRRQIAEAYLIQADILELFDSITCGDDVQKGKPNPDIFLKASKELNCSPETCIVVEDSENGLLAASRAGALPIWVKDIKEPKPEIKKLAWLTYKCMSDLAKDLIPFTPKFPVPKISDAFPNKINHLKVGIHGFGAIGGGYLAQIFSYWDGYTRPSEIICSTLNSTTREIVNTFGKYNVHYGSSGQDQTIDHVRVIDGNDEQAMINMYTECVMVGLSLPEAAIRGQAPILAKGLLERNRQNGRPLTILVILNKVNGGQFVRDCVYDALVKLADRNTADQILQKTDFCETVVNRMAAQTSEDLQIKQLYIGLQDLESGMITDQLKKAPLNSPRPEPVISISKLLKTASSVAQELSNLKITLFDCEPFMPLYAGKGSPWVEQLCQVTCIDPIAEMQQLKNKLSNGTHAMIAWYSSLLGYSTIGQGMGDQRVLSLVQRVMQQEIKPVMLQEYSDLSEYIDHFISGFISRCQKSFQDPCTRVGRDPLRKLQGDERIFGTIHMAQTHHIPTPLLESGAALGLLYAVSDCNPQDEESQFLRKLYLQTGDVRSLLTFNGSFKGKEYQCLDPEKDSTLISRVSEQFHKLMQKLPAQQVS